MPKEKQKNLRHAIKRAALLLQRPFAGILIAVTICGATANLLLLKAGLLSLPLRTAAACVFGYMCFFIITRSWLKRYAPSEVERLEKTTWERRRKSKKTSSSGDWVPYVDSGEELLIVIGVFFVFILLAVALNYLIAEGGIILAETVVEYAFFAGLIKTARHYSQDWYRHLFTRTVKPFLLLLVTLALVRKMIALTCPQQHRLGAIVSQCWMNTPKAEKNA